jgi:hypothetical protein
MNNLSNEKEITSVVRIKKQRLLSLLKSSQPNTKQATTSAKRLVDTYCLEAQQWYHCSRLLFRFPSFLYISKYSTDLSYIHLNNHLAFHERLTFPHLELRLLKKQ